MLLLLARVCTIYRAGLAVRFRLQHASATAISRGIGGTSSPSELMRVLCPHMCPRQAWDALGKQGALVPDRKPE